MSNSARDTYLTQKVITASPPRLHLMLVEAALGNLRRAAECVIAGNKEESVELLLKSQTIVAELMAGLLAGGTAVGKQLAGVYTYAHRRLIEALVARDGGAIKDAERILEYERETWSLICERLMSESPVGEIAAPSNHQSLADIRPFPPAQRPEVAHSTEKSRGWEA